MRNMYNIKIIRKLFTIIILLIVLLVISACGEEHVNSLTYAVFPYLPDVEYYQEIIESRWAEVEPDIKLVRAQWDCYADGMPEGIDVIMYDAILQDAIVAEGWIQPIEPEEIQNSEDIYSFALEGVTKNDQLYGIPVFLCGNFLIYDQDCTELEEAEHITDLAEEYGMLVINSEVTENRHQYTIEAIADIRGEANPSIEASAENENTANENTVHTGAANRNAAIDSVVDIMMLIDRLAVETHKNDDDMHVALAYDFGVGQGYIGFSESMRLLDKRSGTTLIKSISFSDKENILRLYTDAVAVTAGVKAKGKRYEKCLELMNIIADADTLTALSVHEGSPQYLLLARKAPYQSLSEQYPLYVNLEELASDQNNHVILTP